MSGTPNPFARVTFGNGNLPSLADLGTNAALYIGAASGGPLLRPRGVGDLSGALVFQHGPLAEHLSHHVVYSFPPFGMRCRASLSGSAGSPIKAPGGSSTSNLSLTHTEITLHAQVLGGAPLNITSGWIAAPSPLPATVISGINTVAHTQTWRFFDENGEIQTETLNIPGPGSVSTRKNIATPLSVTSNIDPVGTQSFVSSYSGPQGRYDAILRVAQGGPIQGGFAAPQIEVSLDGGRTWGPSVSLLGETLDLYSYAPGLTAQSLGITANFTSNPNEVDVLGSKRAGGTTPPAGDILYAALDPAARIEHVRPSTINGALSVSVNGKDVTVTLATGAGTKESLNFGGQLAALTFRATIGGIYPITISTVNDATTPPTLSGSGTNALVIHYSSGDPACTDTAVKSLFAGGVSTATAAKVECVGTPTGAVMADPGDTHTATPLAGGAWGALTSRNDQVVAAISASAPARQLVRAEAIGLDISGQGGIAGPVSIALIDDDGGVAFVAKQENVALQVIQGGVNSSRKVVVVSGGLINGKRQQIVKVYLDTDASGARTSTAAQIASLVNADSAASRLLIATAEGTGAGLASPTDGVLNLQVDLNTGDQWAFTTEPPAPAVTDLEEALLVIEQDDALLSEITCVALLKDGCTQLEFQVLEDWLQRTASEKKRYLFGVISGSFRGSRDEQVWVDENVAAFTGRGTRTSVCAGEVDFNIPSLGAQMRRNCITGYIPRLMNCPISELPSHTDCETLLNGIQQGLPGIGSHVIPGSDPSRPRLASLWEQEAMLTQLHARNMVTFRLNPTLAGVFVRQGVQFTLDGDDYIFIDRRRIADVAAAVGFGRIIRVVNATLLTDSKTGALLPTEKHRVKDLIEGPVKAALMGDGARQHVSDVTVWIDPGLSFALTHELKGKIFIVPRQPVLGFSLEVDLVAKRQ